MHSNFLSIFLLFGMIKRLVSCLSINKLSTNQTVKSLIKLHRGYLQKKKNYTEASHVYPHPISIHQSIMTGILGRKNMERKYYAKKMDVCNRVKWVRPARQRHSQIGLLACLLFIPSITTQHSSPDRYSINKDTMLFTVPR